jgi:hypothetical protein
VVGCDFFSEPVQYNDQVIFGLRILAIVDIASHFFMHKMMNPTPPAALKSHEVIAFLKETIEQYGVPRRGVVVNHSAWLSSTELALDEDTAPRGEFLQKYDIQFGPMAVEDEERIHGWITSLGIRCEFDADNIGTG